MTYEMDDSRRIETKDAEAAPASKGNAPSPWQRPKITVIDIRRTMLIVGSVIDGISGSI
jgi:hypothetical protein